MLYRLNDIDPSESVTLGARQLGLGRTRPEANRDPAALGRSTFRGNATTCYWDTRCIPSCWRWARFRLEMIIGRAQAIVVAPKEL